MELWYQLDFNNRPTQQLLVEAEWFAGTFENPTTLRGDLNDQYDHWHWEVFLQRKELVPVTHAAAQLAMSVEDFRKVAVEFNKSPGASAVGDPWANGSNCVVRKSFLRDFHKGFERLRRTTFGSQSSYIRKIHAEIETDLKLKIKATEDETDKKLGVDPPGPGFQIDCITEETIGLGRDVFLETGKPISLAPDCCSWLTYSLYENILNKYLLGSRTGLDEEMIARLRRTE